VVRSNPVTVVSSKIATVLTIDCNPKSGSPPLTVRVDGLLLDANSAPLFDKPVNILVDGKVVTSVRTFAGIFTANVVLQAGEHTVQAEFLGDATYEGCEPAGILVW